MRRFSNPFSSPQQEYFGSASQIALQQGGSGVANASGWYSCRCVVKAHVDAHASMSVKDTPHGLVVKCFAGCRPAEIKAALRDLKAAGGFAKPSPPPPGTVEWTANDSLRTAASIWHASSLNSDAPLLQRHIREHRRIMAWLPRTLRFHPSLYHAETGTYAPGMVAVVQDVHGEKCGIHRTWIDPETGGKAKLDPVRKALCPTTGRSVHLEEPYEILFVSEGIENGLSFREFRRGFCPVWAALSAPGIASLIVPDHVQKVVVACDNDKAGIDAANRLAARLSRQTPFVSVERVLPPAPHLDFNDWLRATRA